MTAGESNRTAPRRITVLLGAGASYAAGLPLTNQLALDLMESIEDDQEIGAEV
jgi:hypothetical protein